MNFFKELMSALSIGVILIILGKFIKDKFIKLSGFIICILAIAIPCIAFSLGFIDAFK